MFSNSQIKEFFKNQTVFLTGGSGFLGKILMEKLLRECEEIKKIYVLLRPKKGKTPEQRFKELFNHPCFDVLKSKHTNHLEKVFLVNGDCNEPLLGLAEQDVAILLKETTCVIHAAANVKFDQTLKEATSYVRATKDLLEFAKRMLNLKVFVFVSTAFSNCVHSHITEQFYEPPMKPEKLLDLVNILDDDTLQAITPQLLNTWPNTYVYTKSVSENLIKTIGADLPITIVRPAIVISTIAEPIPGWIDNFYGLVGVSSGAALGVIRSMNANPNYRAPLVPVDYVSNCILAAAWKRGRSDTTTIYNYVGHENNQITWGRYMRILEEQGWNVPPEKILWYFSFKLRKNRLWHKFCVFFLHTVTAYMVDFVLLCLGRPTLAVEKYRRLNRTLDLLAYFGTKTWKFDDGNVVELWNDMNDADKRQFCFNMENIDFNSYGRHLVMGARYYLFHETPATIPKAKRKMNMLFFVHYTVIGVFWYILFKLIKFFLSLFF
ncbi:fatty acyl-CoA reductase wat-like [Zophobas morio]|uniref:fatty acyl-CoA reductase wat-like n=1 Tax=Zophobas morio TaxID=2755281 RepID=UPI0030836194